MQKVEIIYDDTHLIVINKPAGLVVHGGPTISVPTLVDFLIEHYPDIKDVGEDPNRPGIVHRLDKDTSGVMVIARTQKSFEHLKKQFQDRLTEKTYIAVSCGKFKELQGIISYPIGRLIRNPLKRGADTGRGGIRGARDAETAYRVLGENDTYSLVELKPKTGRMHQLRVHLRALNRPVACDSIYGGKNVCCPSGATRQLLHAHTLTFSMPSILSNENHHANDRKMSFTAELPDDMARLTIAEKINL